MSEQPVEIQIGGSDYDLLKIRIKGRSCPNCRDFWDGNWLVVDLSFSVGAFHGDLPGMLRNEELFRFRDQLVSLYQNLRGEAVLETLEGWFSAKFSGDGLGHIQIDCRVEDSGGNYRGNYIQFMLEQDQTFLPPIIQNLNHLEILYPVIGK